MREPVAPHRLPLLRMAPMPRIEIKEDWCKGCYICIDVCPRGVLEEDRATFVRGFHPVVVARPEDCTGCRLCELLCPDLAIAVYQESKGKCEPTADRD